MQSVSVFGWNALGHRLVAQIAYDHMTVHARQVFNQYNQAMDKIYKPQSWVNAAVWLDTLCYQDVSWFATMHYVDLPFSNDGSPLPITQEVNALWAIDKATHLLLNKYANDFDKGTALRVLMHVVGDVHQPLHAATRVSVELPNGDRGGNLVVLGVNPIAKNLHTYWDRGAGLLSAKRSFSGPQLEVKAANIEQHWPCNLAKLDTDSRHWVDESHVLAVNIVYKPLIGQTVPDKAYQSVAKKIAEQRIALAGCRLAELLNRIDETLAKQPPRYSKRKTNSNKRLIKP